MSNNEDNHSVYSENANKEIYKLLSLHSLNLSIQRKNAELKDSYSKINSDIESLKMEIDEMKLPTLSLHTKKLLPLLLEKRSRLKKEKDELFETISKLSVFFKELNNKIKEGRSYYY